jgi:hypothetical protein
MLAGMAEALADPSGLFGTMKEGVSGATALVAARTDLGTHAIARASVANFDMPEGRTAVRDGMKAELTGKTAAELGAHAPDGRRKVGAILATKMPEHVAASEGGSLGFGGVMVGEPEDATLATIGAALA